SREISQGMGISLQKIEATKLNISEFTTTSIEAYKYFLKGREEYEKLYYDEARQSLEKAVILDPEFAVAYLYLARSARGKAREEAYEKAKMHSEKATEKERLYIEAAYATAVERDPEKRFRILKQMAKEYPKEKRVHYDLGNYYAGQENDKAIKELNKALELDPNYGLALNQLALGYASMGDFEKAIEYFKRYISVSPKDANPLDSMALCYFWMGRLEEAEARYKEALEIKPDWSLSCWALSYIYALKENYPEAMKWVDQGIAIVSSPSERAEGLLLKGFFYFWLGRLEQSLRELGPVSDLAESLGDNFRKSFAGWMAGWVYYERGELELARRSWKSSFDIYDNKTEYTLCLGAADVKEGRIDSAKSRLAEVKSLLPEVSPGIRKDFFKFRYDLLRAEVLLAEGSLDEAIAVGKKLLPLPSPTYAYIATLNLPYRNDVLARCYRQKGKLDKAIAEYEQLITFYPESKSQRLIHPKYHYQLAKLYEEKSWEGKAIDQYEKFLSLWKDADPGIAEVKDARKRVAGLKSQ
ncbi:MAG: tetratricopeptide repeat protein, partial [Candidatus Aminicenantaceae bacterium]